MRDMAIVKQLQTLADVQVDWLVPEPGRESMAAQGYRVLNQSDQLRGSGRVYDQVFSDCVDEFNLIRYIRADTRLHKHDFLVSAEAWEDTPYDGIVGDEAFWLLSGFGARWASKPAPFVFLTDFIGTKAMRPRLRDVWVAWYNNLQFAMSHWGTDRYLYIGSAEEIPDQRLGVGLPSRRAWAEKHCEFVKPIADLEPVDSLDRLTLRWQLGLPQEDYLFLGTVGPQGDARQRVAIIEAVFDILRAEFEAHFVLLCPEPGGRPWIHYARYLEGLPRYFAAADFVLTESGYGKIVELSAIGTPFIAYPLPYHFEQEYVMRHRLHSYGTGQLMTLRDHTPQGIAAQVRDRLDEEPATIEVDNGQEVARTILESL
jgi:hypothetical protein